MENKITIERIRPVSSADPRPHSFATSQYSREELNEALTAISSTVSKIEKVAKKDTLGASQRTLIERRLKALRIASELITAKLEEIEIS